jgi:hypothetical protein
MYQVEKGAQTEARKPFQSAVEICDRDWFNSLQPPSWNWNALMGREQDTRAPRST